MTDGSEKRDAGIEAVAREEWQRRAREFIFRRVPTGWEGLFEDIRVRISQAQGFYPPHHHNAWGALAMHCIRQGWLVPTGRYSNARSSATHAHRCQILRKA